MSRCDNCKKKFTCKRSKYYKESNGEREGDKIDNSSFGFLITLLSPSPLKFEVII